MSDRRAAAVEIEAPAKLNLGLEIVGRRPDGFHEVVTLFQAVTILDRLTLMPAPHLRLVCDDPAIEGENLTIAALSALRERTGTTAGATLRLDKRIPIAAGLGGASSDAAAALTAGRLLWDVPIADPELADLGAGLGSDVPFFLRGGTALATGRGERLEPLPTPSGVWFVVVSPAVVLPRKTATLYAALAPEDFSDGSRVRRQANLLRAGERLDGDLLVNAFARPLARLRPELAALPGVMREEGANAVGLSGAGPSHYAVVDNPEAAARLAACLSTRLGSAAAVTVAAPWTSPPVPRRT